MFVHPDFEILANEILILKNKSKILMKKILLPTNKKSTASINLHQIGSLC